MVYLLIVIGFALLIKGADLLVDGASSIAKRFGISSLVIGLTIVAFGTSVPELVVNMISGFSGNSDLAISNILGSNISNILLILGLTAIFYPISMPSSTIKKEIPFVIFISFVLILLLFDGVLSRFDAVILGFLFILFLIYTFKIAKLKSSSENITLIPTSKSVIFILLGLVGLVIGGKLIVDNAVLIATGWGVPNSFIGVTIVAIGTSLPELAASLVAAFKKNTDLAIGGIVGSNIFNTLWILGLTGAIIPLERYKGIEFDLGMNLIVSILIFIFAFTFKKNFLDRKEGVILFLLYVSYIVFLIYNLG